ncbi:MAG: carboxypeptidase regulatory-like domain-containing protein [Bacteroidetes bacterium]|nr:carboxypeptidase regulatory-like domain-containing protein [Bacteroidota bacterium]
MKKVYCLLLIVYCLLFFSCHKEGPGGKATIKGVVKHNSVAIPGAAMYIKYGAKESPGTNVTYYDESVTSDAQANYKFADLRKGSYYLFAVGFDSLIIQTVTGGIPIEIKSKTENVEADVPVTGP